MAPGSTRVPGAPAAGSSFRQNAETYALKARANQRCRDDFLCELRGLCARQSGVKSACVTEYRELETRILAALREEWDVAEGDALWLEVFAFQTRWNEPYAKFCATRPAPRAWREIPAVPLAAFKTARLSVVPPELVTKTFLTSGTTGETRGAHHFPGTRLYERAVNYGWARLGRRSRDQFALVAGTTDAPHSSLSHMISSLTALTTSTLFFVGQDGRLKTDRLLESLEDRIRHGRAVALPGTALAFLRFFEELGTRRLALPKGSYALETGGFKGSGRELPKAELYAMFGEYLGLAPDDVINEYGMTELSSQFYTRGLVGVHEGPPWARAVVIDPETGDDAAVGETGVLRIFDLANLGSVLAVETQDLAVRRERGFELIGRDPAALPRGCSRAADERMRG